MITIKASEFKAKCLKMLDTLSSSGETVIITKHGKPVAKVLPYGNTRIIAGFLQGQIAYKATTDTHDDSWSAWNEERNLHD